MILLYNAYPEFRTLHVLFPYSQFCQNKQSKSYGRTINTRKEIQNIKNPRTET